MSIERRTTATGQARWEVRFRGLDGRERSRTFRTKSDAIAYERQQRVDMQRGVWTDPQAGKVTLAAWSGTWQAMTVDLSGSTQRIHATNMRVHVLPDVIDATGKVLAPGLGDHPLAKLTTAQLAKWIAALSAKPKLRGSGPLAPAMVHQVYRSLHQCLEAAVTCGHLGRNPLDGVKPPRVAQKSMRFLNLDEVARVVDEIDPRYQALVLIGAYCGLRIGEVLALRWENVDLLSRTLTVVEQVDAYGAHPGAVKPPKTSAGRRSVSMPRFVAEALGAHGRAAHEDRPVVPFAASIESRRPAAWSGLVFTAAEGGSVQLDNYRRRVWAPAVAAAGLEPLRIHDLRHTCASIAIQAGADVKVLQRMLGHASAAVTLDRYGHLMPGQAEAVADRLDALHLRATTA